MKMLKHEEIVDSERIRSSLFLCVRSVRYMTEQLVTIVSSLNEGTGNNTTRQNYNRFQEICDRPSDMEREKTSCEDITSESVPSNYNTNSTELSSNTSYVPSRTVHHKPNKWKSIKNTVGENDFDMKRRCPLMTNHNFYQRNIGKATCSRNIKNAELSINASSQTLRKEDKQSYTTPDKFTQTTLDNMSNKQVDSVTSFKSDKDCVKYGIKPIQSVRVIPVIQRSGHSDDISPRQVLTDLKIHECKSRRLARLSRMKSQYPQPEYLKENVYKIETLNWLENPENYEKSQNVHYTANSEHPPNNGEGEFQRKDRPFEERKTNVNVYGGKHPADLSKLNEHNSVTFSCSTSNINLELEKNIFSQLKRDPLENQIDHSLNYSVLESNVDDFSFYDHIIDDKDSVFLQIGSTNSSDVTHNSSLSEMSGFNSKLIDEVSDNSESGSKYSSDKSENVCRSKSNRYSDLSVFSSRKFEPENTLENIDSLASGDRNFDCDSIKKENHKCSVTGKYLEKIKSISFFNQTNTVKYRTINSTNHTGDVCKQPLCELNDVDLSSSSFIDNSSMRDASTLSLRLVLDETKTINNSNQIAQIFIDSTDSKEDLEFHISQNNLNSNQTTLHVKNPEAMKYKPKINDLSNKPKNKIFSTESQTNIETYETIEIVHRNFFKCHQQMDNTREDLHCSFEHKNPTFTSCVEDCYPMSFLSSPTKRISNEHSCCNSNGDGSLFYDVVGFDCETYRKECQAVSATENNRSCFLKSIDNMSPSFNSKSETVILQATLEIADESCSSSGSGAGEFRIRFNQSNISLEDDRHSSSEYQTNNQNSKDVFSCFEDSENCAENQHQPIAKVKTNRKFTKSQTPIHLNDFHIVPGNIQIFSKKKRHSKVKKSSQSESIIECFLDNL